MIKDEFATGAENYKEFFWALVALAGEGQNFDGNGMYVRFQTGGGDQAVSMGTAGVGAGELFGNNVAVPLGNRPFYPGKRPPYRPDVPCYKQQAPEPQRAGRGQDRAHQAHGPAELDAMTARSASTSGTSRRSSA